ncbi:LysR substrate-binding domain-containing protein [Amphritea balenae]|uniref:LysR family transcriptional regulator n=1 Tax=Amphritea balenae TaxID=452629 RepID=A0A3P1SWS2_9GAMM|nr:LysR substrate-binding domain-containing protein [Amphritea balenae]RRD01574.1 LysR family transcriptional regulator [Amphritea balenae]GGK55802.1 LysR family transcriptional regulator [Amphritea balenae]
MNFTLKQLRYFTTAGEFGSVTKAAETLHVSQPSISSAVLHLEEVTGLQLFVRHHAQGLSLTPAGRQFILKAKQLLSDAEGLGHYANTLGEDIAGTLRIIGFPTFTPMMLPSLMRKFTETYPDASIQCDEGHQKEIIQQLADGRYELALTYDLQIPADIEFEPIVEFPPYAVLAADHPLADKEELSLEELAEYPMILLDWPMTRDYFFSLFLSQDLEPDFAYRAQSLGMVRGLVSNGFGYTLFNTPLVNKMALDGTELKAIPLRGNLRPLRLGVAKISQFRLTPVAEAFIKMLKERSVELTESVFTDKRFYRNLS